MKYMPILAMAVAVAVTTGCMSTTKDHYRAQTSIDLGSVHFQPIVEVIEGKTAEGSASSRNTFWFFKIEKPKKFSNNISSGMGNFAFKFEDPLRAAAVYAACEAVGADILLAPRFTDEIEIGFLCFNSRRKVTVKGVPAKIIGAKEVK